MAIIFDQFFSWLRRLPCDNWLSNSCSSGIGLFFVLWISVMISSSWSSWLSSSESSENSKASTAPSLTRLWIYSETSLLTETLLSSRVGLSIAELVSSGLVIEESLSFFGGSRLVALDSGVRSRTLRPRDGDDDVDPWVTSSNTADRQRAAAEAFLRDVGDLWVWLPAFPRFGDVMLPRNMISLKFHDRVLCFSVIGGSRHPLVIEIATLGKPSMVEPQY